MGRGIGGKERFYSGSSPRVEERGRRSGWGVAPPSRNLWVGNLSSHVTKNGLFEQFVRFGDIESIAFLPGRSYAFVNFKREDDAVLALRGLQGLNVTGMPLRIEFAKGDEDYPGHKDERRSVERGESNLRRDLRSQHYSPEKSSDKSKGSRSEEPSEELWIGFPTSLNVDEMILRRAFSPFGEIEKVTSFPGRSYAFVRYRSVVAACRAKEALQGKLFNNPRVRICFARSDMTADHGKVLAKIPSPPRLKSDFLPRRSEQLIESLHGDRSFEGSMREFRMASPQFGSSFSKAPGDSHGLHLPRNKSPHDDPGPIGGSYFQNMRMRDFLPERTPEDVFERSRRSPEDGVPPWRDLPFERPQKVPPFADSWGTEDRSFPLGKKLKLDLMPDKDLPEYPFSDLKQESRDSMRKPFSDFPVHRYSKPVDSVPFNLHAAQEHLNSLIRPRAEIDDYTSNILSAGSGQLSNNPSKLQRFNPESHKPSQIDEIWKWEGTIAKGGTPVCRARCFPVGKVLDFMLPEILNCTAKTGLDMLAKHYYQAAGTWVVFFVPEGDADISLYNEFMHYLGEKQRVAVVKLDEKVTLFLVPPSDFSEQVLKVPGKVSISGVILKFHQTASNIHSLHHPMDAMEPKVPSISKRPAEGLKYHEDNSFQKPDSPDFRFFSQRQSHFGSSSVYTAPVVNFPSALKVDDTFPHSTPAPPREKVHEEKPLLPSNFSRNTPITGSVMGSFFPASNPPSQAFGHSFIDEFSSVNPRVSQGTDSSGYMPEAVIATSAIKFPSQQEIRPQASLAALQPEQLAQLAAILVNKKQTGKELPLTMDDSIKQSNMSQNPSTQTPPSMLYNNSLVPNAFGSGPANSSLSSPAVGNQIVHGQQLHVQPPEGSSVQNLGQHFDGQAPESSREDVEADPEKRLQATLQLAAALLQQIQQRSKTADER
ncbi:Flowering time control protein FPA [Apostasia shenzhenica]|uniref:Flowering time control protein FPA n=1 Tax=Apostasia shenzhenica TaxID=1088818 RepID=A0A2I0AJU0_9ASPA|nr:Flowering time control protein FPA [Apostasia shenzhenica]